LASRQRPDLIPVDSLAKVADDRKIKALAREPVDIQVDKLEDNSRSSRPENIFRL